MSDGIQITIPDFNDDEYDAVPTPFGRSAGHGFGYAFGTTLDSPTAPTTLFGNHDRAYFPSHNRANSAASIDSTGSGFTRIASRPTTFAHSSQSSITTTSASPFSKKPSFASIRNAFKSGKIVDAPPVPSLEHQPYPILKNPFNRSTSSLNHSTAGTSRSVTTPSGLPRPPTPPTKSSKSRYHAHAKSHHSQTGSIYHASDSSDPGHFLPSSPPPVPRVPNGFGHFHQNDTPPTSDLEEDKVVIDPKTPSDFALHAVFIRFADLAEQKIETFLRLPLDQEPSLAQLMGKSVDLKFDDILLSLGKIAQKHAKAVIDSIMRWRRSQNENVGSEIITVHTTQSPTMSRTIRMHDIPGLLNERKSLASIYIMCRALIAVLQSLPKDALGDAMGYHLEETIFDQFRRPELKLLHQSTNHQANAELYAMLLGHIANIRFLSVTDRFLAELGPLSSGQVLKDNDQKYEYLLKGLQHIQIKVWPPEAFEEGAEFLDSLSKSFANAHGQRLKITFAEILVQLLHPIGKTAQAETNNPQWAKAIEVIYPKARELMSKPRYWQAAFPLAITSLCVAPQTLFLKNWISCLEASLSKLKEKSTRTIAMNGIIRLFWTYLYRCPESPSTTTTRLESLLKHFFPANKQNVQPPEDRLEPFIYIMHFIISRHVEYGQEYCLELMQEPAINHQPSNVVQHLAFERTTIAVQALLLSLHILEKDVSSPAWPTGHGFSVFPPSDDYPTSSEHVAASVLSRFGVSSFIDRCMSGLAIIATHCQKVVGGMSVSDEQWSFQRSPISYEDPPNLIVRHHMDGSVIGYPSMYTTHINLLRTCFESWPRFHHLSIPIADTVDMLLRGVIHVEPSLSEAACDALKRFVLDKANALMVLSRLHAFLFSPAYISQETQSTKLLVELPQLLSLLVSLVDIWLKSLAQQPTEEITEAEQAISLQCREIEAGALFLALHESWPVHSAGLQIIRSLGTLLSNFESRTKVHATLTLNLHMVECFQGKHYDRTCLCGFDELLEVAELARLEQWRQSKSQDLPLRIAGSDDEKDRKLWRYFFPLLAQLSLDTYAQPLFAVRESVMAAVSRYHPTISHLAGLSSRVPPGLSNRNPINANDALRFLKEQKPLVDQWFIWVKVLCATASVSEPLRPGPLNREHTHVPSDAAFERERLSTTRGLFRYLTPFLDSEYTIFRDAAVLCISSFPPSAYSQLLEDLGLLASRQFYDDPRSKLAGIGNIELNASVNRQAHDDPKARSTVSTLSMNRLRRQERLHSAVARIYYLTAHLLQQQRITSRQTALANVLKFVRNTQAFLSAPEVRDNYVFQRLRRYFCGTVERLFNGLATFKDSDRFIPSNMHLTLYRLCEEWCQLGPQPEPVKQRLILMQRAAAASSLHSSDAVERFKGESVLLSQAAIGALTSLCQKAFFLPDLSSGSPTDRSTELLTAVSVLERFSAILSSSHAPTVQNGKKALRSLLISNTPVELMGGALWRAAVLPDQPDSSNAHFFEVICDIICAQEDHGFSFGQAVCLALSNLCNPSLEIRRRSFKMLEATHVRSNGLLSMFNFEPYVCSLASGTYLHSHRLVSDFLAGEHPNQAYDMLVRIATWLPPLPEVENKSKVVLLLLQSLEFWIPNIQLMTEDTQQLSQEGILVLYHLMSLTLRYGETHCEQILTIWSRLVDSPSQSNGHAAVRFMIEHSHKVGSTIFVSCAANIIACLCQTHIGQELFDELCSVIEPSRMLPTIDHKLVFPEPQDLELWAELDSLFSEQPRLQLGSAQFAWLFLTDVAFQHHWEVKTHLSTLLHVLVIHLDHRNSYVRCRARHMLLQLLASWIAGLDELPDRSLARGHLTLRGSLEQLAQEVESQYWREDEAEIDLEPKLVWFCARIVELLEPSYPALKESWGSLALNWGTSCSIRQAAFRSLQVFRALSPRVKQSDMALLLGRLSNTIAASTEENLQPFNCEIIRTVTAIAKMEDTDQSLLPQLFWTACAGLSTTVQEEFLQVLILLDSFLTRYPLEPTIIDLLLSNRPKEWTESPYLQLLLLKGLRSSTTLEFTFKILFKLSKIQDDRLIEPSGRVRDLYTLVLPWCLHAMSDKSDDTLKEFAQNISVLAAKEGRHSIQRIMTSFAKGSFRTKDDFLRQSVSSLREHYGREQWTEVVTLLLSLVLNQERWLQIHSMQILKLLFQQRETRNPFELLGSELLMPLLRLLETDLSMQALDVLEEPIIMSNSGPAAKHVLRMSMHMQTFQNSVDSVTTVFGIPEESGWCIAQIGPQREVCRANVGAVFDTCSVPMRPSRIDFEPEVDALAEMMPTEDDLGGLVKDLHELTTFFQEEPNRAKKIQSMPNRRLEARVAAILAKSTATTMVTDIPQTPFIDVFRIGSSGRAFNDEDEDDSDSDSEDDAFIFDAPDILANRVKSFR